MHCALCVLGCEFSVVYCVRFALRVLRFVAPLSIVVFVELL